ncbi:MAG TPA: hypothetical protein VHF25_14495 [Nitriliruptorales bacterium]|nr:hypothetical protein [Nitriliruptorales bacterium]
MVDLTSRETWTVIHGLVLGTLFLLAFAGVLAGLLWSLRPGLAAAAGLRETHAAAVRRDLADGRGRLGPP